VLYIVTTACTDTHAKDTCAAAIDIPIKGFLAPNGDRFVFRAETFPMPARRPLLV
jgi:hypothetical protein